MKHKTVYQNVPKVLGFYQPFFAFERPPFCKFSKDIQLSFRPSQKWWLVHLLISFRKLIVVDVNGGEAPNKFGIHLQTQVET